MDTYIDMLLGSLEKKLDILEKIMIYQNEEMIMLKAEDMDLEVFDKNIDDKVTLAQSIEKLDDGFEQVYNRIREELIGHKADYTEQIRKLQDMIAEITEKNTAIQAQESRIKLAVDTYVRKESAALRQKRDNGKAARSYYNNMKKLNFVDSQFLDRKK